MIFWNSQRRHCTIESDNVTQCSSVGCKQFYLLPPNSIGELLESCSCSLYCSKTGQTGKSGQTGQPLQSGKTAETGKTA